MTMPAPAGVLCGTAPGRAEWLGNHTDYNDGLVLGIGLDVGTAVRATKRPDRVLRMEAQDLGQSFEVSVEALHPVASGSWANYVIGVAAGFVARGAHAGGLDLTISSTVPIGAGLSSSAALECATGRVLQQAWGTDFDELELARIGQEAEHNFAGVRCGLLDQVTFENSCEELDFLVSTAQKIPGCLGARLTGGGFGGAILALVVSGQETAFVDEVQSRVRTAWSREPECLVTAAGGA